MAQRSGLARHEITGGHVCPCFASWRSSVRSRYAPSQKALHKRGFRLHGNLRFVQVARFGNEFGNTATMAASSPARDRSRRRAAHRPDLAHHRRPTPADQARTVPLTRRRVQPTHRTHNRPATAPPHPRRPRTTTLRRHRPPPATHPTVGTRRTNRTNPGNPHTIHHAGFRPLRVPTNFGTRVVVGVDERLPPFEELVRVSARTVDDLGLLHLALSNLPPPLPKEVERLDVRDRRAIGDRGSARRLLRAGCTGPVERLNGPAVAPVRVAEGSRQA